LCFEEVVWNLPNFMLMGGAEGAMAAALPEIPVPEIRNNSLIQNVPPFHYSFAEPPRSPNPGFERAGEGCAVTQDFIC
jgi:hypothetical protein